MGKVTAERHDTPSGRRYIFRCENGHVHEARQEAANCWAVDRQDDTERGDYDGELERDDRERCPASHQNDGDDICARCGTDLQEGTAESVAPAVPSITPGLWSYDTLTPAGGAYSIWTGGVRIAVVDTRPLAVKHQEKANARAIAEVPAMLAKLRQFVTVTPDTDPIVMFALVEQTRALLARVEGR